MLNCTITSCPVCHPTQDYRFLPKHKFLDTVDSAEKFKELERTMDLLEISGDKQETVRKAMAAIILLGEVDFQDGDDGVTIVNRDVLSTGASREYSYIVSHFPSPGHPHCEQ